MKLMLKSILTMMIITTTANMLPHGGGGFGGGFATGALVGTGITLAATSGSRRSEDPAVYNMRSLDREISRKNRELDRARRDAAKGRSGAEERVKYLTAELNDLRKQRAMAAESY